MCALLCLQDLKTIAQLSKYGTKKLIKSKLHTEGLSETCPSRAHRCTSETNNIKLQVMNDVLFTRRFPKLEEGK